MLCGILCILLEKTVLVACNIKMDSTHITKDSVSILETVIKVLETGDTQPDIRWKTESSFGK